MSNAPANPPENQDERLQVLLLGPLAVWRGNQAVDIPRRLPRFLLCYLALTPGAVARQTLAELVAAPDDDDDGRQRLTEGLYRLRQMLQSEDGAPSFILQNNDNIYLDSQRVEVDWPQFADQYNLLQEALHGFAPDQVLPLPLVTQIETTLNLWRSPILFDNAVPDLPKAFQWMEIWRRKATTMRHWLLDRLSAHYQAAGQPEQALEYLEQISNQTELDAELFFRWLSLLEQLGRYKEARQRLKNIIDAAESEGIEVSPAIRQKHQQLKKLAMMPPDTASQRLDWQVHRENIPFIGRAGLLNAMQQQYYQGGSLFVLGESGVGKTRLLKTFIDKLTRSGQQPGLRVLMGRCYSAEQPLAWQPLLDALRQGVARNEWARLDSVWAGYLAELLPEIHSLRANLPRKPKSSPEQQLAHVHQALSELFKILAENQRLVLVMEDIHWANTSLIAALGYLLQRPPFNNTNKACLMLLSVRSDEMTPAVQKLLETQQYHGKGASLKVERLTQAEVAEIIERYFNAGPAPELSKEIHQETGGNSLYLSEALESLGSRLPGPQQLAHLRRQIPSGWQKFMQSRLEKLSQPARRLLQTAALLGHEFDAQVAVGALGLPADVAERALSELLQRQLIERQSQGDYTYYFCHDKFRQSQQAEISGLEIRRLHQQIVRTLEKLGYDRHNNPAILAHHYEQAEEYERAVEYWTTTGQQRFSQYALDAAREAFRHAEELVECCQAGLSDPLITSLYYRWSDMLNSLNDAPGLYQLSLNLRRLGELRRSAELTALGYHLLSFSLFIAARFQEALEPAEQALALLKDTPHLFTRIRTYRIYGTLLTMQNRLQDSLAALQQAESELKRVGHSPQSTDVEYTVATWHLYYELAFVQTMLGNTRQAFQHGYQSLEYAVLLDQGDAIAFSSGMLALAEVFLGRYEDCLNHCRKGLEMAAVSGSWRAAGYLHIYSGMAELALGRLDASLAHAEAAIQIGKEQERREIYSTGYHICGDIFSLLESWDEALAQYSQACAYNKDTFLAPNHLAYLGFVRVQRGQVEQGLVEIQTGLQLYRAAEARSGEYLALAAQAAAYIHLQDWDNLEPVCHNLMNENWKGDLPHYYALGQMYLGIKDLNQGQLQAARQQFESVVQQAVTIHSWSLEFHGRRLLAATMQALGESIAVQRVQLEALKTSLAEHCQHPRLRPALIAFFNE